MIRAWTRVLGAVLASLLVVPTAGLAASVRLVLPRLGRRLGAWHTFVWSRLMLFALGVRVRRADAVDVRRPAPLVVAPNHVGYLDILVVGALAPCVFVSRADLSGWPVLGQLARLGGTIFLDRGRRRDTRRAAGELDEHLAGGLRVAVFLEGRAGPGDLLRPFRSSLLRPAAEREVPVVPVALRYRLPARPDLDPREVVSWCTPAPFAQHAFRLARAGRVTVDVTVCEPRRGSDRKELAALVEGDVRRALNGYGSACRDRPAATTNE